jgi:membrane protein
MAAEAGFWAIVSLPSALLTLFGALGYFRGVLGPSNIQHIRNDVLRGFRDVLTPTTVNTDVAPILDQILSRGHLEVVSVGFLITLWSGSTAMSDYVNTITVAYEMRNLRGSVRSRVVALGLYLGAIVAGVVLLPALALGPDLITGLFSASIQHRVSTALHAAYWPFMAVVSVVVVCTLYRACLPVKVPWRSGLPGAAVAMALWLAFSIAARAYLSSSLRARSLGGSLSAPIAALLFFYFTALAVLVGAELNAAIAKVRASRGEAAPLVSESVLGADG